MKTVNTITLDSISRKAPLIAGYIFRGLMYVEQPTHLLNVHLKIPQFLSLTDIFFLRMSELPKP